MRPKITKNEYGSVKCEIQTQQLQNHRKWARDHETWNRMQRPKMSYEAQNTIVHVTVENKYGSAKCEKWTQQSRYRQKWVWDRETWKLHTTALVPSKMSSKAQNVKTKHNNLETTKNEYIRSKFENWMQHPQNRKKRVR
jgi:hypothetical protein